MREWKLKLEKEGISEERYSELKAMARRYDELKKLDGQWRRGELDRKNDGNTAWRGHSDPTAREGERLASNPYAWKVAAIERAAVLADAEICRWLLRNVTQGIAYEKVNPPCSRERFFKARRNFFVELHRMTE